MSSFVLATNRPESFSSFVDKLKGNNDVEIVLFSSCQELFEHIKAKEVDVVVADEQLADCSGLEMLSELVKINPMLNCALVSELPPKDFHEVTEGLGLFMQLPLSPGGQDAVRMMEILSAIGVLLEGASREV